ncbi:MAG: protein-L-isoaspartate(D-aspartate) O-methyltransferase [Flavobacteriales bacterium]|nr:protein-L-isoaspartate(D-aspartate) O-methyltransferase [Flavobacteriales bacterium]
MQDTYKNKGRRKRLVELLRKKGISDENVLNAIGEVPRHYFFPADFEDEAYEDKAFPIGQGQTISQPYTVAFQTQLLQLKPGSKVLEIGTGSGYQAAILAQMGVEVFTIERIEALYRKTIELFEKLKLPIHCFWGDGSVGLKHSAPFDGIVVTAGANDLAEHLKEQLAIGGNLVLPLGSLEIQKMVLITRLVENKYERTEHGEFKFVPLLGKHGWKM